MPKKLTKREKARLFEGESKSIDCQERDKKWCMEVAGSLGIILFEENAVVYSKEGDDRKVFHKPTSPQKIWTETRWILQEVIYQKLKAEGKVWGSDAKS